MAIRRSELKAPEQFADTVSVASSGALRVALLFGSAAVALALILTPIAERQAERIVMANAPIGSLDSVTTGSIGKAKNNYTIRRSVLQNGSSDLCVIRSNGTRIGNC